MPNDDLGQFPTPTDPILPSLPPADPEPVKPDVSALLSQIDSAAPPKEESAITIPNSDTDTHSSTAPTFEETPEVIPSIASAPAPEPTPEPIYTAPITPQVSAAPTPTEPSPATLPTPKGGSGMGSLIVLVLLLISGVALAVTVFLFSQSQQLKQQLSEVTQTLEQQRTTVTPTPTPTIIDFPTPTATPEATVSAAPTATPEATPKVSQTILPLADASKVLKVAIKHMPNAQLILIKSENATDLSTATTKYFFRQDLTTKKYFYVLVTSGKDPEIVDKAIYVTPDNNIPSLNDHVQGNTLGIDLDQALTLANSACTSKLCETASVKAQYIKSGTNVIWQLSFTPADATKSTIVVQINATTKEILFKSAGF